MKRLVLTTALTMALAAPLSPAAAEDDAPPDPRGTAVPPADLEVVTPPAQLTEAVRAIFPEAYSQFMTVAYERQDAGEGLRPEIWPKYASFLVPAAAYDATIAEEIEARVVELVVTVLRPGDAHCEGHEVGEVEDFAWMAWPDKRVRRITIHFGVAC